MSGIPAVGGQADMVARLRAVLPARWFADDAPVLDGVLAGLGQAAAQTYALLAYARAQTRMATAGGLWLDLLASDWFGGRLMRRGGEADTPLRARIRRELLRERGTRAALVAQVTQLVGRAPTIFEPSRPADTGAWGIACGYGVGGVAGQGSGGAAGGSAGGGGWGSLGLPFQCFVTVRRPRGGGIAMVDGYCGSLGGYGVGAIEYASAGLLVAAVGDADIMAAIAGVMPAAAIAWTRIVD